MKTQILTKLTLATAISLIFLGCGDGNKGDNIDYENLSPPTHDGDRNIVVDEESGILVFDMLDGVTNPGKSQIFTRKFTYLRDQLDADGEPLLDENGQRIPNWEGAELPFRSIYKSVDTMFIVTDSWKEVLVHPDTVAARNALPINNDSDPENDTPMLYSNGIYKFTYLIDNGAEETIERNFTITVQGIEDKVEDIVINHSDGFTVAKGYTVQLNTTVMPLNATYKNRTYTSSDETIATVSSTGLVSGIDYGNVTFTITSADGEVVKTISAVVEDLVDPLGVDVMYNGAPVTELTIPVESTFQLGSRFVPDTVEFDNSVTWTVEPAGIVEIDYLTGEMKALQYDAENPAANKVVVTATIGELPSISTPIQVTVGPSANYFYGLDPGFENGELGAWTRYWETPETSIVEVSTDAAKDGMYGLHINVDRTKHAGITLPDVKTPQVVGEGQNRNLKFSYDLRINNYTGSAYPMRLYFVPAGAWADRIEKWHSPIITDQDNPNKYVNQEWVHVEVLFDEKDWSSIEAAGRMDLYFIGNNGGEVDAYMDNLSLELVEDVIN
ncbi:Ig-like domain-containing protein [Paraglaciecola sp. L3A3]|uniref:Ig-like domain-containing protein n=1 Tax=Paraglaciecola sp. L3A3 TaxID=2686358 RepID=UPI00131E118E|nr:Ig-like domain-containing protein [Paraglaciecola sp. L3A3]